MKHIPRALGVALTLLAGVSDLRAQQPPQTDGVRQLLRRVEEAAQTGDAAAYLRLVADSANPARANDFSRVEIQPGATRAVVQERDRVALPDEAPGTAYRVFVDAFVEFGQRARVATWRFDIKRMADEWRIVNQDRLTTVENLYRLSLDSSKQFDARDLTIAVEDLDVAFDTGSVFVVDTDQGVTGLVLVGRGEMRFHPRPETEKGQVRIFGGSETLVARFDTAFVRINPYDFARLVAADRMTPRSVDARQLRKADEIFREDCFKSFHLNLGDLSADSWSLLPRQGDVVAEIHTRRYGTLTYAHSSAEAEDITLFDRKRHKNIALYASAERIERRGLFYNEDDLKDYDVLDYSIDVAVAPGRQWLDGVAHVLMKVRAPTLDTLTLRLADSLVVRSIASDQFGRLFAFRVRNQGGIVVNLPATLTRDTLMTLTIVYGGRLEPQVPDRETVGVGQDQSPSQSPDMPAFAAEPSYLYSNRSYWYPQASSTDYATATIRISVPAEYDCVASGELEPGWPQVIGAKEDASERKVYWFSATRPLRYLAFIVSRFARSDTLTVALPVTKARDDDAQRTGVTYDSLRVSVEANPRETRQGRALAERAANIAQFYSSIVDDCPYPAFTIALIESDLPGGHSPAYFAALNEPLPTSTLSWRGDPAAFDKYPEFFLAHELAHQWWGQAVGWRNYHEQWLSEGFAQYFAALYAQNERGSDVFAGVMRQMRRWAVEQSDQGPIYLGYRLGHLQGDSRVFRALVYNKGAVVLHMLRRLVGDEAFFRGLRRFYTSSRFRKAGTDDFRQAVEAEAGRPLGRFFERWIYGSTLPRLKLTYRMEGADLAIHVEQIGEIFDVPVTVTLQYADKKRADIVVPVTDRTTDVRVPLAGTLREVGVSKDDGTLAEILK